MSRIRYARFWKCALQVNPWDYAAKYRGVNHGLDEAAYNLEVLNVCKDQGIEVVGVSDHGSVTSIDALRHVLTEGGVTVFPGFEIASSEKAHFVCLFEGSTSVEQLNRYLGALDLLEPQDGVRPSSLSAVQLLGKVEGLGGFIYAAHCTEENGILQRKLNHVWQNDRLRAAQIPGALDDLKNDEGHGHRQILLNKDPNYERKQPLGVINARDVAVPEDLEREQACCLVRMTEPGFAAFEQAFLDPGSRVRLVSDLEERHYSRIERLRITGGYLDGVDVQLSGHLDAVIGGRGTGKTTLLECIRYALEQTPTGERARQSHREIVKEGLGPGRIEIVVRSFAMQGQTFTVSRRYGESTMVKDHEGNASAFTPADILPRIEIFGQNEIFDIVDDVNKNGLDRLLRRYLTADSPTDRRRAEIRHKLEENAKRLLEAQGGLEEIEAKIARLPKLEEQAKQGKALGLDEKLAIVPKLERQKQLTARVDDERRGLEGGLTELIDALPDVAFLSDRSLEGLPDAEPLTAIRTELKSLRQDLEDHITRARERLQRANVTIDEKLAGLRERINDREEDLKKAFAKIPDFQGRTGREIGSAYQQVLTEIERIRPLKATRDTRHELLQELRRKRDSLLADLSEANATVASEIDRELKRLQRKLAGKLRPSVAHAANREPVKDFLLACDLEGVGEARLRWLDDADEFSPVELARKAREGRDVLLHTDWGITPMVAEALAKLPESKLLALESMEVPDVIRLELNIAENGEERYRPIEKLSTGQKCTAVLHLLLLDNLDPLVIDQPEDNLDNAFIASHIVTELRTAKLGRQFVFATHNANIPVFGDAEWIGAFEASEGAATMPENLQGAVDVPEVQAKAAAILEGGREAFIQRKQKYGF